MTIAQLESVALGIIESKNLAEPSIQKRALGRITDFLRTTGIFIAGNDVALPSDKGRFKSAFEAHVGREAKWGEPTVINIIYRISEQD